jgi:BlaI family penicillinase repressor
VSPQPPEPHQLSRRERQIMDVVYARGEATAADVLAGLPDPPGYSAVRALLRILEGKGHLRHRAVKGRYVYRPVRSRAAVARGALRRVLGTFFDGSPAKAVAALLEGPDTRLTPDELRQISELIEQARKDGR